MDDMNIEDWNEGERDADYRDKSHWDVGNRNTSGRNVRARVRSGRRGRVCGRGRVRRGRGGGRRRRVDDQQPQWMLGQSLEEIWVSDEGVPSELKELSKDVMRRRVARAQEMRDRVERDGESEVEAKKSETANENEFQDATDGRGNPLLLEGESLLFEWSPMETFRPQDEIFTPEFTGSVECHQTPYDAFRSFWDDSVIEHIVDETNRYARKIPSSAFQSEWSPTNAHEVMCLFAFWMMLGIVRMPTIKSCFSRDPLLKTEIFRKMFTENRYVALARALHFMDPATVAANPTNSDSTTLDPLCRLRPIITHLNAKFQANYVPSRDIFIDKRLTLWNRIINIKQCIGSNAAMYGIKTFELCESATGYLWSFILYTGKESSLELQPDPLVCKSTAIVRKLIDPLLNKGYRLFMDNWYSSPHLARFLKLNGTDCVGILRPSRQDVPALINQAPLKQGQLVARHSGDVCVLSWQDQKRITMISTCHGSAAGLAQVPSKPGTRPLHFKPQVILDYNKSMGGVDLNDEMLEPYLSERKTRNKWYMKLFKWLLNVSILNARIIMESSLQCRQDHLNFRLRLVDAILTNHLAHCPVNRRHTGAISRAPDPCRLIPHIHWPVRLEEKPSYRASNRKTRVRCNVCLREGRADVKTTYKCEACNVPLCADNCFKKYHTT